MSCTRTAACCEGSQGTITLLQRAQCPGVAMCCSEAEPNLAGGCMLPSEPRQQLFDAVGCRSGVALCCSGGEGREQIHTCRKVPAVKVSLARPTPEAQLGHNVWRAGIVREVGVHASSEAKAGTHCRSWLPLKAPVSVREGCSGLAGACYQGCVTSSLDGAVCCPCRYSALARTAKCILKKYDAQPLGVNARYACAYSTIEKRDW